MIEALIDHLWQSTLFALVAAGLALVFHRNGAHIRFRIWLAASVKFLIPFPLLIWAGQHLHGTTAANLGPMPQLTLLMDQVVQPASLWMGGVTENAAARMAVGAAPDTAAHAPAAAPATIRAHWSVWAALGPIWLAGFVALLCRWAFQWGKYRAVAEGSEPLDLDIPTPIPVRETASVFEPGIFGIRAPLLLLPRGIAAQLAHEQLNTILTHELCHLKRRDNLTGTIHMSVEALFWFHPLVWWLGGRMLAERERACDEAVIQAGGDRRVYAEGILKVCQLYVEPPLPCAAGVSGGSLRKRIEDIMTNHVSMKLHLAKKCLLLAAGSAAIVGPFAVGLATGAYNGALAQESASNGAAPAPVAQGPKSVSSAGAAQTPASLNTFAPSSDPDMKRYSSPQWGFSLDIPQRWNAFPAVPTNSPEEVIRFASREKGIHLLIVFRSPYDPKQDPKAFSDGIQQVLTKGGFSNFVSAETTIGGKPVLTLDFSRTMQDGSGRTWYCRQFFVIEGTLVYTLGFGTSDREVMFGLYDRMAKSFTSQAPAG